MESKNKKSGSQSVARVAETNGELALGAAKTEPSPKHPRPPRIPSAELGRVFMEPLGPPPLRRPTGPVKSVDPKRLQEVLVSTFNRLKRSNLDMEALIYYALQSFDFQPDEYVGMYRMMREHIMKNLEIHQSGPLRLKDVAMYRLTVCCPSELSV